MAGVAATGEGAIEVTLNFGQFLFASVVSSAMSYVTDVETYWYDQLVHKHHIDVY
jgi:hypothetical protein